MHDIRVAATVEDHAGVGAMFAQYRDAVEPLMSDADVGKWVEGVNNEIEQLSAVYAAPGFLLVARDAAGDPAGCVAVKSLGAVDGVTTGEVCRMFVSEEHRSTGLGRRIMAEVLRVMSEREFQRAVLNSLPPMTAALALYRDVGFEPIGSYTDLVLDGILYFGRPIP